MARRAARPSGPTRALLAALAWALLTLLSVVPATLAAGPPFDARPDGAGAHLVDEAEVIPRQPQAALEVALAVPADTTGTDIVTYLQVKPASRTPEADGGRPGVAGGVGGGRPGG